MKKQTIKPLIAYAVVSKRTNKINIMDIFGSKDIQYIPSIEKIIKVEIRACK